MFLKLPKGINIVDEDPSFRPTAGPSAPLAVLAGTIPAAVESELDRFFERSATSSRAETCLYYSLDKATGKLSHFLK